MKFVHNEALIVFLTKISYPGCISHKDIVSWLLFPSTGAKRSGNQDTFKRKYAKNINYFSV